ncbi:ATP-binding protein [archaeon]|nr:MAG: ATP-binding protein [archaeon]
MNAIGTVISTEESPNSSEFSFVISENAAVKKGQHVTVDTSEGKIIARVSDIVKTNRYFERAESVQEFERSGKPVSEVFPSERWEYIVANAVVLGVYNDKHLMRSAFPVSPGAKVFSADGELLKKFFGFDLERGLNIGTVEHHDIGVRLNLTKLLQKHLAILAMSGAGKSYFTSVLLEELLNRKKEDGQMAVIVIDTHGEYIGFAEDRNFMSKSDVIVGDEFRISVPSLSSQMIAEFLPSMTSVQQRELGKFIAALKAGKKGKSYDMKDLLDFLESSEIKAATKDILYTFLHGLESTRMFSSYDNPPLEKLAKAGHLTVLDISDITSLREKQILVTYIAKKLFDARREGKIPPFLLVLEEAHNFAPEGARREAAISRNIIEKIAREGRKFHACLCLISQRPVNLSTTALSQCNTNIFLRVTNPYDLDHIGKTSEGLTNDVLKSISSLRVGEAIIAGEAVNFPLFIKVRERTSKKNERGIPLEEAAILFTENDEKKKEDAEAFM